MDFGSLMASGVDLAGKGLTGWLNHEESQNAQAFAERMASTQYQRTVADLKAAGLNPMLAYMNTDASPSVAAATVPDYGDAGSTYASVHSAKAAADLAEAQAQLPRAQKNLLDEQSSQAFSQAQLNTAQNVLTEKTWKTKDKEADLLDEQIRKAKADADSAQVDAQFNKLVGGAGAAIAPGVMGASNIVGKLLESWIKGSKGANPSAPRAGGKK